jgi:hypothetical protein
MGTFELSSGTLSRSSPGLADGVILMAPDQTIVWANEAALKMHVADCLRWPQT